MGWLDAKEMWLGGCQSLVAILRAKGQERRVLTVGRIARPLGTAREPFCQGVSCVVVICRNWNLLTGGQKSSWKSTTINAGLKAFAAMVFPG